MKKLTVYLICIFCFTSCEKGFDLYPRDKYSEATFFQNEEQFKLYANQFYYSLPGPGANLNRDTYSDLLVAWSANTVSNGSYYPTPTGVGNVWADSYKWIRNTTYLLEKAQLVPQLADRIKSYKGEAHFFRAMACYNLLKDFGGVPVIDKVLDLEDNELLYGKRNTREETVDYIFEDLDNAVSSLPEEAAIAENDKGRVSKEAALALKARIALFEGTWRKYRNQDGTDFLNMAAAASQEVIHGNRYQLFDRRDVLGDDSYRYFFILDKMKTNIANLTKADQNEYILTNKFDVDFRTAESPSAHQSPSVTKKFADLFLCRDGLPTDKSPLFQGRLTAESEYENRDLRMTNVLQKPFTRFWANYPPEYNRKWEDPFAGGNIYDINFGNTTRTAYYSVKFRVEIAAPFGVDYPVIRLAEVLLIHAEALYEKNGFITDEQLDLTINKLRARAGLPRLTNDFVTANGLNMQTEIRRERTIELFIEGFRFDDLRRWKTAEYEMPQALKGVLWTGTQYDTDPRWSDVNFPTDADGHIIIESADKRTFEEKHYLFPLPTRQILLNPELEQNPGWK
ncbi:MAG: RagB/SusD family nutrient uptake outer membrane protein [Tannerella sp.]|jgi:hypothetical protein|nr:RagB/SusD family nutrient uptake outer membrane protein [Tannerella sp.]